MTKSQIKNRRKNRKAKRKRCFRTAFSAVIIIVMAFAVSSVFKANLLGKDKYILGFRSFINLSDSMSPVIQKGSFLITQRVNPDAIRTGDIITYREGSDVVTQRVVQIIDNDGAVSFITRGDANEGVNSESIPAGNVIGRFVYAIGFAGKIMVLLRNPIVMLLCVAGACAFILSLDAINRRIKKSARRKKRHRRRFPQSDLQTPVNRWRYKHGYLDEANIIVPPSL